METRKQKAATDRVQRHVTMIFRSIKVKTRRDMRKAYDKCTTGTGLNRRRKG